MYVITWEHGKELLGTKRANIKININIKIHLLKNEKMLHFGRQHWECCLPVIALTHLQPTKGNSPITVQLFGLFNICVHLIKKYGSTS